MWIALNSKMNQKVSISGKGHGIILFYRCNCLLPCSRKLLKIQTWRSNPKAGTNSDQETEPEKDQKNQFGFAFFQVITYLS